MASYPRRRAAVVVNPVKVDVEALRAAVASAERDEGYAESLWLETTEADPGLGMARRAVGEGIDVVMAAGGDGTVRSVAEGLRGSDCALALVPSGTGNLLARNLAHPLTDLAASVSIAFGGRDRPIDLGVIETVAPNGERTEQCFVVMVGIGVDAEMAANTDESLKKRAGWIAYLQPIISSMSDSKRVRVRYRLDDDRFRVNHVHTLVVGNCGDLPGRVRLLPEAAIDDGLVDLAVLRPDGVIGWGQIWSKIMVENALRRNKTVGHKVTGLTRQVRALRYLQGRRVQVQLQEPEMLEIDGDPAGEVRGFAVSLEHHGLQVRVPA